MINIHQVAAAAEVSTATVSRAFNKPDTLKPETLEKVHRVARDMNYIPNIEARNLRQSNGKSIGMTRTIGFLAAHKTLIEGDPFSQEIMAAVIASVCERGYGLKVVPASVTGGIPQALAKGEVDALIARFTSPLLKKITRLIPTVSLDYYASQNNSYSVVPDYEGGLRVIMDRLFAAGHRKIALLAEKPNTPGTKGFWRVLPETFRQIYAENGVEEPSNCFLGAISTAAGGYRYCRRLFASSSEPPEAIIGPDAAMPGVYKAAAERGIKIPADISVVGINGLRQSQFLYPTLTTLDVGIARICRLAVNIAIDSVQSGQMRRGFEITPVDLILGGSAKI